MKFLIIVISLLLLTTAQAQVVSEVITSKSEYEYGEPIEITYRLSNKSNTFHAYQGTSTYAVYFEDFSGISLFPNYTTLDDYRDTLWPGEYLEYTWSLDPKLIGLPPISGEQTVSISVLGIRDSVSFQAPQYRGGPMSVYFNEELVDSASADSILAHYNIEIMRADYPSFKLEVNGYPIDSLSQAWQDKNYILEAHFSQRDMIEYIDVIRTNTEQIDSRQVFRLDQNYPNPFNPTTNIPLSLDRPSQTNISVYKITGEFVYEIYDGWLGAGQHYFSFTAPDLASGTYMYKVRVGDQEMVKTMTLIK